MPTWEGGDRPEDADLGGRAGKKGKARGGRGGGREGGRVAYLKEGLLLLEGTEGPCPTLQALVLGPTSPEEPFVDDDSPSVEVLDYHLFRCVSSVTSFLSSLSAASATLKMRCLCSSQKKAGSYVRQCIRCDKPHGQDRATQPIASSRCQIMNGVRRGGEAGEAIGEWSFP